MKCQRKAGKATAAVRWMQLRRCCCDGKVMQKWLRSDVSGLIALFDNRYFLLKGTFIGKKRRINFLKTTVKLNATAQGRDQGRLQGGKKLRPEEDARGRCVDKIHKTSETQCVCSHSMRRCTFWFVMQNVGLGLRGGLREFHDGTSKSPKASPVRSAVEPNPQTSTSTTAHPEAVKRQ